MDDHIYCTLVLNDLYVLGAVVLAHSLRDCGTTHKLACLVVPDTLSALLSRELQSVYDYIITVPPIGTPDAASLYRADLQYTFTKIQLWRQTQFRKVVYIDADVVALRAPDELFGTEQSFAAVSDPGWPDTFNSGVMVLTPDIGVHQALLDMVQASTSFDGADQGLLNQFFEHQPWKRLSYVYNCTQTALYYQYEPAYRYFKSRITLVHFIGRLKPWNQPRFPNGARVGYQELLSRWWAVHDRHGLDRLGFEYVSQPKPQVESTEKSQ